MFREAIKAAIAYKENSSDFLDQVMRELEVGYIMYMYGVLAQFVGYTMLQSFGMHALTCISVLFPIHPQFDRASALVCQLYYVCMCAIYLTLDHTHMYMYCACTRKKVAAKNLI